jgi:hypothetical protein
MPGIRKGYNIVVQLNEQDALQPPQCLNIRMHAKLLPGVSKHTRLHVRS